MKDEFIFIGGTYRGYQLLKSIIEKGYIPSYIVILKEDDHEHEKVSGKLENLAIDKSINYGIKKKLDKSDFDIIYSKIWSFGIVCGWRSLIPIELDRQFQFGLLAAHDSLLPKYRGFAPLNWAIINGEKETGVTLFRISDGEVDSGNILHQEKVTIEINDYAIDVYEKITQATINIYFKFLNDFENGVIKYLEQNENEATYTCKRNPEDGEINWNMSSSNLYNFIRGLAHPYPGAFFRFKNKIYHVRKSSIGDHNLKRFTGRISGKVITIKNEYIEVMCLEGSINIYEIEDKELGLVFTPSDMIKSINTTLK